MARLFLIRHGEPEAQWGGAVDDPGLSPAGAEQAARAGETLRQRGLLRVISSPKRRCLETAAPYMALVGANLSVEPRVSEVVSPAVADRRAWLLENFPWRGGPVRSWDTLAPDLHGWRDRMLNFCLGSQDDAALFTHFIAINVIVGAALGCEETIVCKPGYASITELSIEAGRLRLVRLGEEMQLGDVR